MCIANREGGIMIDDKTRDLIAAVLTMPVAQIILEGVKDKKHMERELEDLVDKYFSLRTIVKGRYDKGV